MVCNVPNCIQKFDTIFGFETHYSLQHRYSCGECRKNLPSAHLLDLHLSETHDSFFAVLSEKKPMFSCFNEECTHKSITSDDRRDHCMTEHKFPQHFRFDRPIKVKKVSSSSNAMDVTTSDDTHTANPKTFNFGHNKKKSFEYSKVLTRKEQGTKTKILEDNQMVVDLLESLPN